MSTTSNPRTTRQHEDMEAPAPGTVLSSAERAQRGRAHLQQIEEQLATSQERIGAVQRELAACAAHVGQCEDVSRQLIADGIAVRKEIIAARAALLIAGGTVDEAATCERLVALDRRQEHLTQALRQADADVVQAAHEHDSQLPALQERLAEACAERDRLQQMAGALREAIASAHTAAGQERLAALRAQHVALLEQRHATHQELVEREQAVHLFYQGLATQLGDWPELAGQSREQLLEHPLTLERDITETFLLLLDAFERQAGVPTAVVGGVGVRPMLLLLG